MTLNDCDGFCEDSLQEPVLLFSAALMCHGIVLEKELTQQALPSRPEMKPLYLIPAACSRPWLLGSMSMTSRWRFPHLDRICHAKVAVSPT